MKCDRCGKEHHGSFGTGKFCSKSCANTRAHSNETKKKIGNALKGKSCPRQSAIKPYCLWCKTMRVKSLGCKYCSQRCWVDAVESKKDKRALYAKQCQFQFALSEYPELFDSALIERFGWYSTTDNKNVDGISRDHRFSISDGFAQGVEPEIVRHPVNCQLMQHRSNQIKKGKSSITLTQLLKEIELFETKGR